MRSPARSPRGEADVSAALSPERAAELRAHPGVTLDAQPGLNLTFLAVNDERSPFSDVRVRRALSKAMDRAASRARAARRPRRARERGAAAGACSRPTRRRAS